MWTPIGALFLLPEPRAPAHCGDRRSRPLTHSQCIPLAVSRWVLQRSRHLPALTKLLAPVSDTNWEMLVPKTRHTSIHSGKEGHRGGARRSHQPFLRPELPTRRAPYTALVSSTAFSTVTTLVGLAQKFKKEGTGSHGLGHCFLQQKNETFTTILCKVIQIEIIY